MKKILSLVLALCMCMCLAPCTLVSAAVGDVLKSYTFDDLSGVKNEPTLADEVPGFRSTGGKLVYDATTLTESRSRKALLRTANVTGQKMTIEMELCIEGTFPSNTTYFKGRFCGADAAAGAQDPTLFTMYNGGAIFADSATKAQLTIGKTHRITLVLVPNAENTDYTEYFYVDGVSYGQKSVGLISPANLDLHYFTIDLNNSGNTKIKFSIDNFEIIAGESRMSISGADTIYKAPADVSVVYPFKAEYTHAGTTGSDGIAWEITKNADKVKVDANGNVTILDNTVTSFEIKASKTIGTRTISSVKTVTLNNAVVYDFENAVTFKSATTADEIDGNTYLVPTGSFGYCEPNLNMGEGNDFIVFECRVKLPEALTGLKAIFNTKSADSVFTQINCNQNSEIALATKKRKIQINKWFNFKIVNNLQDKTYDIYVDGFKVNENSITTTAANIFSGQIRLYPSFQYDDVKFYNGKPEQKITGISAGEEVLYAPVDAGKNASTNFTATLNDNAFTPEWSLYGTYTGIGIDKNTGKLIINKDAQAGDLDADKLTVTAMATAGGLSVEKSIDVYKYSSEFNAQTVGQKPAGNWKNGYGLVALESNGNYYVEPQLQNNNYDARYDVNSAIGNFVIEARVKLNPNVTSGSLFTYNQDVKINNLVSINSSGVSNHNNKYHYPSMSVDATDWINIKAVMNIAEETTTVFVNGELLGASNIPMTADTETSSVIQIIFRGLDVDDLKVYNINDTAPGAYNAHLENLAIGKVSAPIYDYFDEGGQAEECSSYQWYIGETAGGNFTAISGATGKKYTPAAADLGKYIYVEITPASDESHRGVAVKTAPEEVGDIAIGDITYKVNNVAKAINEVAIAKDGTEQTISLTMPARYTGSEPKNVFIIIGKYVDGQFSVVDYEKVTLTNADTNITVEGNVTIPAEDAGKTAIKAFIWDGTLSPLFEVKNLK